jgi:hypothetical protein
VQQRHELPGEVLTVEWKIGREIVADGFSPADHDETAVQGVHSPHLLVVVDEAGGLGPVLGQALEALMTGGHTRLLVLGNPPTDQEGTWFERVCESPLYNVIPIGAFDTPNFTGEDAGLCRACPAEVASHSVAEHLVDRTWVEDVIAEFGAESAFVEARVHARFPKGVGDKTIPLSWCEQAAENTDHGGRGPVRIGVDVAADGGDEFVIAWADGAVVSVKHRSSGEANANAVDVAGVVLRSVREAEALHGSRGLGERVRVKIDANGVGWGVASMLQSWAAEGKHSAEVVAVNVSERASDPHRFAGQRAEMWWNGRQLLQPQPGDDGVTRQEIRLDVDRVTLAQLAGPNYKSDSSGRIAIERKADMKRRGVVSPDRAEAILLALYEPPGKGRRVMGPVVAPFGISQSNSWSIG